MINLKLQYIVYSAVIIISNVAHAEQPRLTLSVEELKYLAPEIKAAEKSITNIKINSEAWIETRTSVSEPWQRTPIYVSSTAYFKQGPEGKARVDFHKEVLEWKNGPAPYLERNYSVSFDGQYGRYINNSTSYNGKVFHINKYRVLPHAPHQLRGKSYHKVLGINASLNFHLHDEPLAFSDYFQKAADPNFALDNAELHFTCEDFKGAECIKMSAKGKNFRKSWWLDPNRGFALLKHESTRTDKDGNEVIVSSIDVRRLDNVAKNIWLPVEVHFVSSPFGVGDPWKRTVYRATNVVANDPNFDESIFTVPIPEGYSLDEAEYKTIRTGGAAEQEKK